MMNAKNAMFLLLAGVVTFGLSGQAHGSTILGTGTGALVGNDLTDLGNDGNEGTGLGFDATFFSSNEPGFGGGEFAFNVFDNAVGSGNAKWCCGATGANNSDQGNNQIVGAMNFSVSNSPIALNRFTLTSSNDTPGRDPLDWRIEGSNDTTTGLDGTWTTIYQSLDLVNDWTARNQVISYSADDGDVFLTSEGFRAFRMVTAATGNGTSGAFFALNEIEFFGNAIPEPTTAVLAMLGLGGMVMRRRRNAA